MIKERRHRPCGRSGGCGSEEELEECYLQRRKIAQVGTTPPTVMFLIMASLSHDVMKKVRKQRGRDHS